MTRSIEDVARDVAPVLAELIRKHSPSREEDARAASGVPSRDLTDQPKDAA